MMKKIFYLIFLAAPVLYAQEAPVVTEGQMIALIENYYSENGNCYIQSPVLNTIPVKLSKSGTYYDTLRFKEYCDTLASLNLLTAPEKGYDNGEPFYSYDLTAAGRPIFELKTLGGMKQTESGFHVATAFFDSIEDKTDVSMSYLGYYTFSVKTSHFLKWVDNNSLEISDLMSYLKIPPTTVLDFLYVDGEWILYK